VRGVPGDRRRPDELASRLAVLYPEAPRLELRFANDLELLVAVLLSAQTTDAAVNRVTDQLFARYPHPESYLAVPPEELERTLRPLGLQRRRAAALRGTMRALLEEHDGRVPGRLDELVRLPGIGRKSANLVLAARGDAQGVFVDTHVARVARRLGLTEARDPIRIERDLQRLVPRAEWGRFPDRLLWHGRRVCAARRPACGRCTLADLCPSAGSA
jgi:endonuclease-3